MEEADGSNTLMNSLFHDHDDQQALMSLGDIMHHLHYYSQSQTPSSPQTRNNNNSCSIASGSSTLSFHYEDNNNTHERNSSERCIVLSNSNSSNSIASLEKLPAAETCTPKSYILSFHHDSNEKHLHPQGGGSGRGRLCGSSHQSDPKKPRNYSESLDHHIMAERKRRQDLTQRFIALSATIPGLKKIDKASILSEAINYVKQLQERIKKLEDECSKKKKKIQVESASSFFNKSTEECRRRRRSLNDILWLPAESSSVEVRGLEKQVMVRIQCKKQSGVMLNILSHLATLDLSVISTSVLPFGNSSSLCITIIAQMGDKYKATLKDVVRSMRMTFNNNNSDPSIGGSPKQ